MVIHYNVQGGLKCENIGSQSTIQEDYAIKFLSKANLKLSCKKVGYRVRYYSFYFEKLSKVEQLPKAVGVLS